MPTIETHILDIDRAEIPPKPSGAKRVLLFSDLHLGVFPRLSQMLNKRFLGAFNHLFRRRNRLRADNISRLAELRTQIMPDITICAGDLGSVGLPEEFELAMKTLEPFTGDSFFYVPGNHDAYVCDSMPCVKDAIKRLNGGRWDSDKAVMSLNCKGLQLTLINAARPVPYHLSCGVIDSRMQEDLSGVSRDGAGVSLAVCHFPAIEKDGSLVGWRHGLRGASFMREMLSNGRFDAILSGHTHRPYTFFFPDGGTQVCCGSLTLHNSFAVCDMHLDT
ncbi:MAG: metallophosphoesterase [Victivallales bacterium]|nr:metallophosphoesterase [Victivallales bacterium]